MASARTCGQPVSFPACHTSFGGHTTPCGRSNQCRCGFLPVARWFPGKRVVYVSPIVRWAAGRPQGIRGGVGGLAGLFRRLEAVDRKSASVTTRKAITHVWLPSPNLTFSPQRPQIGSLPCLVDNYIQLDSRYLEYSTLLYSIKRTHYLYFCI